VEGAILKDEATGAVIFTGQTRELDEAAAEAVRQSCPYDIPRREKASGFLSKCTMCIDRVGNGMLPACVKSCPTGAMNFGDRKAMLDMANKRLAELKKQYAKAQLLDTDMVRTVFLVVDDPKLYHKFAIARNDGGMSRKLALRKLFRPAAALIAGLTMVSAAVDNSPSE
jgi:formate dehydrogenase iron-sulfur subunit